MDIGEIEKVWEIEPAEQPSEQPIEAPEPEPSKPVPVKGLGG